MTIIPIGAINGEAIATPQPLPFATGPRAGASFSEMLSEGVGQVNHKLIDAEAMATAFAVDDSIPLHQVTYALEQARMSFELMMQVRNRLTEAYQEIMRMQL